MGRPPRRRKHDDASQAVGDEQLFQVDTESNGRDTQAPFGFVDDETKRYFQSIEETLDANEWSSSEDCELFLSNVYSEVDGRELAMATDAECSVILEKLLRFSNDVNLRIFLDRLSGNFVVLFKHFCASHVCQTIIALAAGVLHREASGTGIDEAPNGLPTMKEIFATMCKQLATFWLSLASDMHATFLVRTILSVLNGDQLEDAALKSQKSRAWSKSHNNTDTVFFKGQRRVPESLIQVRDEVLAEIVSSFGPQARAYVFNPITSPVLQQVLDLVPDKLLIISKLLMSSSTDEQVPEDQKKTYIQNMIKNAVSSHLFEKIIKYCSSQVYHDIYTSHFRGQLQKYCMQQVANFVVQALIRHSKTEAQLELLLEELAPHFKALLFQGRPLIVYQFLELTHKYKNYRAVLKPFYQALDCKVARTLLPTLLYLNAHAPQSTSEPLDNGGNPATADSKHRNDRNKKKPVSEELLVYGQPLSSPGNQMAQCIIRMPNAHNKEVIDSFLASEMSWYHPFLRHPIASFTFQAIISSPTVNLPPKRKLLFSLLNHTSDVRLACLCKDKFGSHIIDAFWKISDVGTKAKIAQDILPHERSIQEAFYGRKVWKNCNMNTFKQKRQEWMSRNQGIDKKHEMFEDIIGSGKDEQYEKLTLKAEDADDPDTSLPTCKAEDEIDQVFKRKTKKGPTEDFVEFVADDGKKNVVDKNMRVVLEAIGATKKRKKKSAKQQDDGPKKKKHSKRQFAS